MPQSVIRACALAALMLVCIPAIARAGAGTCTMTATNINFGIFSGSQITSTGSITITCSGGTGNNTVSVDLSYGSTSANFPSSTANRLLSMGSNRLSYQLYTDSTRSTIWGDGSGGTHKLTGVPINYAPGSSPPPATATVIPFGVLLAQALPPFGPYTDVIMVKLEGANPVSTSFNVTANIVPTCSISASNLNFGSYVRVTLNATTTLSATCSSGTAYNIGLDQGTSTGATVTTRAMTGPGGALLKYGLFQDAGHTINWGNTVGADTESATGTGSAQTFAVFGSVPALQSLGPGTYQDTITATLYF